MNNLSSAEKVLFDIMLDKLSTDVENLSKEINASIVPFVEKIRIEMLIVKDLYEFLHPYEKAEESKSEEEEDKVEVEAKQLDGCDRRVNKEEE